MLPWFLLFAVSFLVSVFLSNYYRVNLHMAPRLVQGIFVISLIICMVSGVFLIVEGLNYLLN